MWLSGQYLPKCRSDRKILARLFSAGLLCLTFAVPSVFAIPPVADGFSPKVKLIVLTEELPPYSFIKDGRPAGFSTEIAEKIIKTSGLPYQLHVALWEGAYTKALNEENVLIFSMMRTSQREDLFYWVGHLAPTKVRLWKLTNRTDINNNKTEDVLPFSIALLKNGAGDLYVRQHPLLRDARLFNYRYMEQIIPLLTSKRIDLIASLDLAVYAQLDKSNLSYRDITPVYNLLEGHGLYLALSKKSDKSIYQQLVKAYIVVRNSGFIETLRAVYFND